MISSLLVFLFASTSVVAYRRYKTSRDLDHTRQLMQCRIREVFKKEGGLRYVAQHPCL
jgi:hypothetical protein